MGPYGSANVKMQVNMGYYIFRRTAKLKRTMQDFEILVNTGPYWAGNFKTLLPLQISSIPQSHTL